MVFDAASYDQMTGEKVDLTGNQVILFAHNKALIGQKQFTINGQDFQVKEEVSKDFITDHVSHQYCNQAGLTGTGDLQAGACDTVWEKISHFKVPYDGAEC